MEDANTRTLSSLVAAARRGEHSAQNELHRRFVGAVMRRIRRQGRGLRRGFDTADLAQSVFVEVLRDLPRLEFRGEPAFRRWLQIKADNKVRAKYRRQYLERERREEAHVPVSPGAPYARAVLAERAARVRSVLLRLTDEHRQVLVLRQGEGLPYQKVAVLAGLTTADAARMRHARAIVAFRREWNRK